MSHDESKVTKDLEAIQAGLLIIIVMFWTAEEAEAKQRVSAHRFSQLAGVGERRIVCISLPSNRVYAGFTKHGSSANVPYARRQKIRDNVAKKRDSDSV